MEQPIYYWDPVIAPSGMAFYTGALFPAWRGSLFVGGLGGTHLARLTVDGERIIGEERLLTDLQPQRERIRDVRQGPDGALYILTDSPNGRVLKLVPKGAQGSDYGRRNIVVQRHAGRRVSEMSRSPSSSPCAS